MARRVGQVLPVFQQDALVFQNRYLVSLPAIIEV